MKAERIFDSTIGSCFHRHWSFVLGASFLWIIIWITNQNAYFIFIFACVPNLMSQIPSVLISFGASTKVTLLPVGSRGIQLGRSRRSRLLQCKTEGQIELCTKVCTITTVLHHVHPGEDRGAQGMISTCNTHYIYIKLHQYAPISLYLKDSYDLWTVSYSILYPVPYLNLVSRRP